jgi:hypothetical protein
MSLGFAQRCAGVITTTTGSIGSGSNSLSLTSAIDFINGHGVWVVLDNGTMFTSWILSGGGTTTLTLNDTAPSAATTKNVGHDDTLAIQSALDTAGANSTVIIPDGSYYLSTIKLNNTQRLFGTGMGTLLVSIPGNTNAGMVQLKATTNTGCVFDMCRLAGGKTQTPAPTCGGIQFDNTSTVATNPNIISNVQVLNMAGGGIILKAQVQTELQNVTVQLCNGIGVSSDATCFNLMTNGLLLDNLGLHALEDSGKYNTWAGLMLEQGGNVNHSTSGDGIHCPGTGNYFSGFVGYNLRHGINIDGGNGNVFDIIFFANGGDHVHITSGNNNRVRGGAALLASGAGDQNLATAVVNIVAGAENDIEVTYDPQGLVANATPAQGALTGNRVKLINGVPGGTGDLNILDCEPFIVPNDWIQPTGTIWEYSGATVISL